MARTLPGLVDDRGSLLCAARGFLHDGHNATRLSLDLTDQTSDLAGGLLGLLGELPHLLGNDCETATLIAGARRFDRGISARRFVWSAKPVMVSTIPPMGSDFAASA